MTMRSTGMWVEVLENRFPEIARRLPAQTARVVRQTTMEIERQVKKSMEGPKHGRAYALNPVKRKATRRDVAAGFAGSRGEKMTVGWTFHRASAPGEAPARWYGVLASSIQSNFHNNGLLGVVFTNTEYGVYLEYGTRKMAARPFMQPAAADARMRFDAAMRDLEGLMR